MRQFFIRWKQRAKQLSTEVYVLYLAYKDPRVPLHAKIFVACVVGYAFSPIDLVPDFIPIIGYVDDLILIPLGVKIALSLIPTAVMRESREKAKEIIAQGKPVSRVAALVIIAIWLLIAALAIALWARARG